MIIKGVNCRRTRSIYYGMAITLSLGCLTSTLVHLWLLRPSWDDKDMVKLLFLYAAIFLVYAILVVRSLCIPVRTVTAETYRMGEDKWWGYTLYSMFFMFIHSYENHSVEFGIYLFGMIAGWLPIKQLSWPAQDIYIQDVVFNDFLCCLSGFLGYQQHIWMAVFLFVFAALAPLSYFVNHRLDHGSGLPLSSKVKQ